MTVAGLNDKDELRIDSEVVPVLSRTHAVMAERGPIGTVSPTVMRQRFNTDVKDWNADLPELSAVSECAQALRDVMFASSEDNSPG